MISKPPRWQNTGGLTLMLWLQHFLPTNYDTDMRVYLQWKCMMLYWIMQCTWLETSVNVTLCLIQSDWVYTNVISSEAVHYRRMFFKVAVASISTFAGSTCVSAASVQYKILANLQIWQSVWQIAFWRIRTLLSYCILSI